MDVHRAVEESKANVANSLKALQLLANKQPSSKLTPLISGLPESLSQLLSSLRHQITALSLAFKPPVTPAAAVAQLTKVHDAFGRIAACVVAASGGETGSALVDEWNEGAEAIGAELQRLLDVFDNALQQPESGSSSTEENPYLIHTGLVWEAIDNFAKSLSRTEVDAVGKKWRAQGEVMKDAWSEFKEFLEDQEGEEEDDFGMDDDDEFGELQDMLSGGKMKPEERARAEAVKSLLGLHQILHATVPRYLPLLVLSPEELYTSLLGSSDALTAAFDTAVAAMYPEQDVEEIEAAIGDLDRRSVDLAKAIRTRLDRAPGDEASKEACRSFLTKWQDRMEKEEQQWKEKGLSVAALAHALP